MTATESMYPVIVYRDAEAALQFLAQTFGFKETSVQRNDEGTIVHAEMSFGSGVLMMGQAGTSSIGQTSPTSVYVTTGELDTHYTRASKAGAKIVREPSDTDYGSRDYAAEDLEGNYWHFGTYRPEPARSATADET